MKTKLYIFILTFLLLPLGILSQDIDNKEIQLHPKNQLGVQFNPYLNDEFFHGLVMNTILGIKYGYKVVTPITIGAEFSGYLPYFFNLNNPIHYYNYKIGIFAKYSFWPKNRIQSFIEGSSFISYMYREATLNIPEIKSNKLGIYLAPGISFFSKKNKIGIDIYYKISNVSFVNGKKSVLSYKVNFNF